MPRPRFLVALALSTALAGPAAWAQTSSYDTGSDPVSVDLSVIDGGGQSGGLPPAASPSYGYGLGGGEGLRVPGPRPPVSQLHVEVPGGRSSPPSRVARSAPAPAPAAAPRKEVAAAPAEPDAAPAAPKAPETAPRKPESAPARLEPETKKAAPAAEKPATPEKKPAETAATETAPAPPPEPAAPAAPPAPPEASAPPPAPEAAPAPEPAAKPAAPEPQTAAADATGNGNGQRSLRLDFAAGETKLPGAAAADLGKLAEQLTEKEDLRVQLLAYAGGDDLSASKARRISLSRALSVRSFLIDKGVRSTRIDVRALGDKTDEEPKNRVDVEVVER